MSSSMPNSGTYENTARIEDLTKSFDASSGLIRCDGARLWVGQRSLEYAVLLLRRDHPGDRSRAAAVIESVLAAQIHNPDGDRGRFPMFVPEAWRDLNATLFMAPDLVEIYTHWLSKLPPELAIRFQAAVRETVTAVDRRWADEVFDVHRDFEKYSNIMILYIQALLLLGRCLDDARLRSDGTAQWQRWFNHVSTYGIDEFCSPTYNQVVYQGLLGILEAAVDSRMRSEATLALDHLSALQHAVRHPLLRMGVVGTSRDYRRFVEPGKGEFRFLEHAGADGYRTPPAVVREFRNRQYPYRASGRAGIVPFRFQTWQLRDAAMGSMTGGHYFPQQIHLMVAVGHSPADRACAFFQADAKNPINGYVAQRDSRALCLFARTATSYRLTQLRRPVGDLPLSDTQAPCLGLAGGWTVLLHEPGRLAVNAYGYTLHLRTFVLNDECLVSTPLNPEKRETAGGEIVGWRAAPDVVWLVCLAELVPHGKKPDEREVEGCVGERLVTVNESGGLALRLARLPSGELVELYDEDWRTQPLFDAPAHRLEPGDWAAAAAKASDS